MPHGRNFNADVTWYVSSMPDPIGPRPHKTSTSPGSTRTGPVPFKAAMAARSVVNTFAGPSMR